MEQFFLHLIAGIIRNTESTDKIHISKESIRNFQHKLKQLPQVHVWKPNQVRHSNSKYFKITKKLLFPQHQAAAVVYHCGIYWQPWTCKGSQKVGTTVGSYCSILMKFSLQNICCPKALTVRTFLFSQWFFSTLREYVRGRIKGNGRALKSITRRWVTVSRAISSPVGWHHAPALPSVEGCEGRVTGANGRPQSSYRVCL